MIKTAIDNLNGYCTTCLVFFDGANLGGGIRSASKREAVAMFCVEPTRLAPVVNAAFMLESSECFFSDDWLLPK